MLEKSRKVARRAAGRQHAIGPVGEPDEAGEEANDRALDGRRRRAHLVHRHGVVQERSHERRERGEGHGCGHLVANAAGMMEVLLLNHLRKQRIQPRRAGAHLGKRGRPGSGPVAGASHGKTATVPRVAAPR